MDKDVKYIDDTIVAICSTPLRVRRDIAFPILMEYNSFLESMKTGNASSEQEAERRKSENEIVLYSVSTKGEPESEDFKVEFNKYGRGASAITKAESGSIAVIPVRGVMMRESRYSWSYGYIRGTRDIEALVRQCEESPNIDAIVFRVSSPGGQAAGNESLSNVIKSCSIPTLVSFEGMASAAVESFIGCNEIYALEKDSYFGSIGTLTTVFDDSKFWEEWGFKKIEIYAPQSGLKNNEHRSAVEGDNAPMKERLRKSTEFFINDVKKGRPQIEDDGRIFKGAIYNAVEAKKIKAIDGIKSFEWVLSRAAKLAKKNAKSNNNKSATMAKETETTEKVEISKEEKSFFDKMKSLMSKEDVKESTEYTDLKAELEAEKNKSANLGQDVIRLTGENTALTKKVETYESDLKELENVKTVEGEDAPTDIKTLVDNHNKVFDHNKELGGDGKPAELPTTTEETTEAVTEGANTKSEKLSPERKKAEIEKRIKERATKKAEVNG